MKRTAVLGLALLVAVAIVVLALRGGLRTNEPVAAVPEDVQPAPPVESSVDELSPPAPDVTPEWEHAPQQGAGKRVEAPDPLEAVVEYLRRANPDSYGSLSGAEARRLTSVELGSVQVDEADMAQLRKLPMLKSISVRASTLCYGKFEPQGPDPIITLMIK